MGMYSISLSRVSLGLSLVLFVALAAGCASDPWACGVSSSRDGCFCTSEEVRTASVSECNAAQVGGDYCCDDPGDNICTCDARPRCFRDGDVCGCALEPTSGSTPATSCRAEPGTVCCANAFYCICGFVECTLADDRTTTSCDPSDVGICTGSETRVSDCVTLEAGG